MRSGFPLHPTPRRLVYRARGSRAPVRRRAPKKERPRALREAVSLLFYFFRRSACGVLPARAAAPLLRQNPRQRRLQRHVPEEVVPPVVERGPLDEQVRLDVVAAQPLLEELIEERTGINTMTAEDPMKVVAIGTGQYVEFMNGKKDF